MSDGGGDLSAVSLQAAAQSSEDASGARAAEAALATAAAGIAILSPAGATTGAAGVVVPGAAAADVASWLLLHESLELVLLLEGHDGAVRGSVGIAGSSTAGVETTGAWWQGLRAGGNAGGGGGLGSPEEVTGATASGVRVGVLGDGGVWLGDCVARHDEWICCRREESRDGWCVVCI